MIISGKRIRRTKLIQSDRYVVAVDVEMVFPDEDDAEPCYEPETLKFIRDVREHVEREDVSWLAAHHCKIYAAVGAA